MAGPAWSLADLQCSPEQLLSPTGVLVPRWLHALRQGLLAGLVVATDRQHIQWLLRVSFSAMTCFGQAWMTGPAMGGEDDGASGVGSALDGDPRHTDGSGYKSNGRDAKGSKGGSRASAAHARTASSGEADKPSKQSGDTASNGPSRGALVVMLARIAATEAVTCIDSLQQSLVDKDSVGAVVPSTASPASAAQTQSEPSHSPHTSKTAPSDEPMQASVTHDSMHSASERLADPEAPTEAAGEDVHGGDADDDDGDIPPPLEPASTPIQPSPQQSSSPTRSDSAAAAEPASPGTADSKLGDAQSSKHPLSKTEPDTAIAALTRQQRAYKARTEISWACRGLDLALAVVGHLLHSLRAGFREQGDDGDELVGDSI